MTKVLEGLAFGTLIAEACASTSTGRSLLTNYQTYLMANQESYGVVNNFIREANACRYDNGVLAVLETVADYINSNKTGWALATACESIKASGSRYNNLNYRAAEVVESLLKNDEEQLVSAIRAGALKNVMYCESFRNIAKQVYSDRPIVEAKANYTKKVPVSMVESVGDGHCFVVEGKLYKMDDSKNLVEAQVNEVSNTFKMVNRMLGSNMATITEETITINYNNVDYKITECGHVTKVENNTEREFTVEQFRDHSAMATSIANPHRRHEVASVYESIALIAESYDQIVSLNHVGVYTTNNDKFVVIECGDNLFATLLASNRQTAWTVNEDAVKSLSYIKSKTNVELNEEYSSVVESVVEHASAQHGEMIKEQLKDNQVTSIRERIALLTEQFKSDPVKLAVLSKLAAEVSAL